MIQKSYSWAYIWRKTLIQNNTSTPVFTAALFTRAKTCMLSCFSRVQLFVTQWTVAHQAPLSRGILQARILEWAAMQSSRGSPDQG